MLLEIEQCITRSIEMNSSPSLTKEIDFHLHFRRGVGIFICAEKFLFSFTDCMFLVLWESSEKPKNPRKKPDLFIFYLL